MKLIIISTAYNKGKWVTFNIGSLKQQSYGNFLAAYGYDRSTDNTLEYLEAHTKDDSRFLIHHNESPGCYLSCFLSTYKYLKEQGHVDPEDVIVEIDGDDWLLHSFVLQHISNVYNSSNDIWMTYGQYITFPDGEYGGHFGLHLNDFVDSRNQYRTSEFPYSHLKTYKAFLLDAVNEDDLIDPQTGEYFNAAADFALCMPMVEQAGKSRIFRVDEPMYVYNTSADLESETNNRVTLQKEVEMRIRRKQPRARLTSKPYSSGLVTSMLAGGLGNMMFQVAAGYALAQDTDKTFYLYPQEVAGMIHNAPSHYLSSLFRNLPTTNNIEEYAPTVQEAFHYETIEASSLPTNVALSGGFQSYRYFEKHKQAIVELFAPTQEVVNTLIENYQVKGTVSLHVRRGDYLKLSQYHHNLEKSYYLNAIDYFKGYNFLVVSDDIAWCKETFIGSNFTFVEGTTDVEDLYLMSMCDHNIIANSTFSWWGAWLNQSKDKVVVYPDKWFGPAYSEWRTLDLFPDSWICLTEQAPQLEVNLFDNTFRHLAQPNGRYSSIHGKISSKVKFVRDLQTYEGISIFTDEYLVPQIASQVTSTKKIGWLIEPRQIQPQRYANFSQYMDSFDYVLTHDQELLDMYPEKTKFTIVGGAWIQPKNYGVAAKSKEVSMIYSSKQELPGHKLRHEVARRVKGVDLYGRGTPRPLEYKEDSLLDYRFSIVIENSKVRNYFSEKLIDSILVGTIPVYWGCSNIADYFDIRGMYIVDSLDDIEKIVGSLNEKEYINKLPYAKLNLETAKQYAVTEDWIYDNIFNK